MSFIHERHVLIVVENLPVPLDRRVWLEATTLEKAGYAVSIISPMGQGWDAEFEVMEGVAIYRYPAPPDGHANALSYAREYGSALWHWVRLARKIWRIRPFEAIHGCNPPDLIFLLAWMYRWRGVQYLFDHHDVCPELFQAKFNKRGVLFWLMRLCERLNFATASVSLATNESFRRIAIKRGGMSEDDVFVVRSAPKTCEFQPGTGDQNYRNGAKTTVGYVGVVGQQEGLDLLVDAAFHLVRNNGVTDLHFLIIGFGPALGDVIKYVSEMGLSRFFTFTGPLYKKQLVDALNAIDIGVACDPKNAMNDISTMNKVIEYMSLAKPMVQFELVEGKRSARGASLYARRNEPVDLADKLKLLIDNPELRARMGAIGRERVLTKLSWDYSEPKLLAAYARLFEKSTSHKVSHASQAL